MYSVMHGTPIIIQIGMENIANDQIHRENYENFFFDKKIRLKKV